MAFQPIDLSTWDRREYFEHFMNGSPCTYSLTVPLDVTPLGDTPLYPALLWLLCDAANAVPEFRTGMENDVPGVYDVIHPSFTVLDKETRRFSSLWTPFDPDFDRFLAAYRETLAQYSGTGKLFPQDDMPDNILDVSMAPWLDFTAFDLNLYNSSRYTLPIITLGKLQEQNGRKVLPLAIQAHHAVCDGWHVNLYLQHLRQTIENNNWRKPL